MDFDYVTRINTERCELWHPGFREPDASWTLADWSNAMAGEAGEVCNVVKKIRRTETGTVGAKDPTISELRMMLADEIADTYLYLDLLAAKARMSFDVAVARKFNAVSVREGYPQRLHTDSGGQWS